MRQTLPPRKAMSNITDIIHRIGFGYKSLFRVVIRVVLFAIGAVAASALIAFPIWYLATQHIKTYTVASLAIFAAGLVVVAVRGVGKSIRSRGGTGVYLRDIIYPFLLSLGRTVIIIGSLYGIAILFSRALYGYAVGGTVVFIVISGYFLYVRGTKRTSR